MSAAGGLTQSNEKGAPTHLWHAGGRSCEVPGQSIAGYQPEIQRGHQGQSVFRVLSNAFDPRLAESKFSVIDPSSDPRSASLRLSLEEDIDLPIDAR